jgi:hypothetical protein
MVMMPNPRTLGDWAEYRDRGIHYVRPSNLGPTVVLIAVTVAVGGAIPLGRNKTAKE